MLWQIRMEGCFCQEANGVWSYVSMLLRRRIWMIDRPWMATWWCLFPRKKTLRSRFKDGVLSFPWISQRRPSSAWLHAGSLITARHSLLQVISHLPCRLMSTIFQYRQHLVSIIILLPNPKERWSFMNGNLWIYVRSSSVYSKVM